MENINNLIDANGRPRLMLLKRDEGRVRWAFTTPFPQNSEKYRQFQ
jgi:hypothetical protein